MSVDVDSVMDEREMEMELLETERVERQTVTPKKTVVNKNEQDMNGLLDNSCDTEPGCEEGNSSSNLLVGENNQDAVGDFTVNDTNHVLDPAVSEDAAEVLSESTASGSGPTTIDYTESTAERDTSSFMDRTVEAVANGAEKLDLPFIADGDSISVKTSDTSLSIDMVSQADAVYESTFSSAEGRTADDDAQASAADVNSASSTVSTTESYDDQLTQASDLSVRESSQSETTAEGKWASDLSASSFIFYLRE